jgi:protein-S-isoprenylcysteine O-methyltransferase Ste14
MGLVLLCTDCPGASESLLSLRSRYLPSQGEEDLGKTTRLQHEECPQGMAIGAWNHLRAIILLPGVVTLVIPGTILWREGTDSWALWQSFPASRVILRLIGVICISVGLLLMIATIRLFVMVGKGTLAPWEPPQRLVVQGVYRHVRNPMMSGALFVLLGEALITASLPLFCWFLVAGVVYALYIPHSEEPGLIKRFGEEYLSYKRNVPRWIPRLTPWDRGERNPS